MRDKKEEYKYSIILTGKFKKIDKLILILLVSGSHSELF